MSFAEANAGVQLKITTIPPGPVYMASTWIRFACKATNYSQPETLRYEWRGFSPNAQGNETLFVDDPLLDGDRSAFIWILSTSNVQYVECHVTNGSNVLKVTGIDIVVTGEAIYSQICKSQRSYNLWLVEVKSLSSVSIAFITNYILVDDSTVVI